MLDFQRLRRVVYDDDTTTWTAGDLIHVNPENVLYYEDFEASVNVVGAQQTRRIRRWRLVDGSELTTISTDRPA